MTTQRCCASSKRLIVNRFCASLSSLMEKVSYGKLSQLQKLVLVALSEPRYAVMKRRKFSRLIKRLYWGKDSQVAAASLSRALQRLEDRGYTIRKAGRWQLTERNPHVYSYDSGVGVAFLAWAQNREFYAVLGLKGPPLEALGIKARSEEKDRPGVKVEGF